MRLSTSFHAAQERAFSAKKEGVHEKRFQEGEETHRPWGQMWKEEDVGDPEQRWHL